VVKQNKLQATGTGQGADRRLRPELRRSEQVLKYYLRPSPPGRSRSLVLEENVVNYVLGKAKVSEKPVSFDELMGNQAQA
jgi:trigger factor